MTLSALGRQCSKTTKIVDANGSPQEVSVPQLAILMASTIIRPEV